MSKDDKAILPRRNSRHGAESAINYSEDLSDEPSPNGSDSDSDWAPDSTGSSGVVPNSKTYRGWCGPLEANAARNASLLLRATKGQEITVDELDKLSDDEKRALASMHAVSVLAEEYRMPGVTGKSYRATLSNIIHGEITFTQGFVGDNAMHLVAHRLGTFRESIDVENGDRYNGHLSGSSDEEPAEKKAGTRLQRAYARGLVRFDSEDGYLDHGLREVLNESGSVGYDTPFGPVTVTRSKMPTKERPDQVMISTKQGDYPNCKKEYWNKDSKWSERSSRKRALSMDGNSEFDAILAGGWSLPEFTEVPLNWSQQGWNCGDVALDIDRERLVQHMLKNAGDQNVRALMAPEIRTAIMEDPALFGDDGQHLVREYHQAVLDMGEAIRAANNVLEHFSEPRRSLEQLDTFFSDPNNRENHGDIYDAYGAARTAILAPAEQAFHDYSNREDVYTAYVNRHYGNKGWMVYHPQTGGQDNSSVFDVAAQMLETQVSIYIRNESGELRLDRQTAQYGAGERNILYNGRDHYVQLQRNPLFGVAVAGDNAPEMGPPRKRHEGNHSKSI